MIIVLFALMLPLEIASAAFCQITATPMTVNQAVPYRILFRPLSTKRALTAIKVTFPVAGLVKPIASPTCQAIDSAVFSGNAAPTCTVATASSGDMSVTVEGATSGRVEYIFIINSVTNGPLAKQISDIKCTSCSDKTCTTTLEHDIKMAYPMTFEPFILTATQVTVASSSYVTGKTDASHTYTMQISNPIVINGAIEMILPKSNLNQKTIGWLDKIPLLSTRAISGTTITVGYGLTAGSMTKLSTPVHSFKYRSARDSDTLLIDLKNTVQIPKNNKVYITISPCTNPPSLQPLKGFTLTSGQIDAVSGDMVESDQSKSDAIALTMQTPANFIYSTSSGYLSRLEVEAGKTAVNEKSVHYDFYIYPENFIPTGTKIYITLPSVMPIDHVGCSTTYTVSNEGGSTACTSSYIQCLQLENQMQLLNCFTSSVAARASPIHLKIGGFTNPPTAKKQYFTVETIQYISSATSSTNYGIDKSTDLYHIQAAAGKITVQKFSPSNLEIFDSTGNYTFDLLIEHEIDTSYLLNISLPTAFGVVPASSCTVIGLASTTNCIGNSNYEFIVISQFTTSKKAAGSRLSFTVSTIQNPGVFTSAGTVNFTMATSEGHGVDFGQYTVPANLYKYSNITSFAVYPNNQIAGAKPTSYTFKVIPRARVAEGAYLFLSFPPEVKIHENDASEMARLCRTEGTTGFSSPNLVCQYDQYFNKTPGGILLKDGFKFSQSEGDPPILLFTIPYLANPRSQVTTGMFNVSIYDPEGALLYRFNSTEGPTVTMTQYSEPTKTLFTRSSQVNGQLFNMTWQFQMKSFLVAGDLISIKIPEPFRYTVNTKCHGLSFWMLGALDCKLSNNLDEVTITVKVSGGYSLRRLQQQQRVARRLGFSEIPGGDLIDLNITEVQSDISLEKTSGSIEIKVLTNTSKIIEAKESGMQLQNTVPGTLVSNKTSVLPSYFEKGQYANYTIKFTPVNFKKNMQLKIVYPEQLYAKPNLTCHGIKGVSKADLLCDLNRQTRTITFTDAFATQEISQGEVEVEIRQFKNPANINLTDSFIIHTETFNQLGKDGYMIDTIKAGLQIDFFCVYPCKTCNRTNPNQCFDCYYPSDYQYYFDGKCYDNCPDGMYENKEVKVPVCSDCKSPCKTCGDNATHCLTCIDGYLLYPADATCYEAVDWPFPFLTTAALALITIGIVDYCHPDTEFLHSAVCFLSFLELPCWIGLLILGTGGHVQGDRSMMIFAFITQVLLNIVWIPVHIKMITPRSPERYQKILNEFSCSSRFVNIASYVANFKLCIFLLSNFAEQPRFNGEWTGDNWQKYCTFAAVYMAFVFLPFMIDFYRYFSVYGLRTLTSFLAMETVIIMTITSLLLVLVILQQCNCAGIDNTEFGRQIGLINQMKKKKKNRKSVRSGRANNEDSFESEYDSEHDYYAEIDKNKNKVEDSEDFDDYEEEEESEEESDEITEEESQEAVIKRKKTKKQIKEVPETDPPITTRPVKVPTPVKEDEEETESEESVKEEVTKVPTPHMTDKAVTPITQKQSTKKDESEDDKDDKHMAMLEELAKQMKDQQKELDEEKKRMIDEKRGILEEKEKYFSDAESMRKDLDSHKENLAKQIKDATDELKAREVSSKMGMDPETLHEVIDTRIDGKMDALKPTMIIPDAVNELVEKEKEADGDDEYWIQNATPRKSNISANETIEKDGSAIEYRGSVGGGRASFVDAHGSIATEEEMHAQISQGPAFGNDLSDDKDRSRHATERAYINQSQEDEVFGKDDGSREIAATDREGRPERASGIFSNFENGQMSRDISGDLPKGSVIGGGRDIEGTDIDAMEERKSAAFGDISSMQKHGSQKDYINKSDISGAFGGVTPIHKLGQSVEGQEPEMDAAGRSDESSEGIVVDHAPFKGIQEAMANQDRLRKEAKPVETETSEQAQNEIDEAPIEEAEEVNKRRIKQVLYSDKSESSVDDMMEDTPSNYNIANGRLEGKSMGLKAILLFAKNQGINLGGGQPPPVAKGGQMGGLPQIQEEAATTPVGLRPNDRNNMLQSSGEGGNWKGMSNPMSQSRVNNNTQIVGTEKFAPNEMGGTLDPDNGQYSNRLKKNTSSRQPPSKQFAEPGEESGENTSKKLQKNNFLS